MPPSRFKFVIAFSFMWLVLLWATVSRVSGAAAAAGFTKRYPSSTDETIFRLNRSRIRSWQTKCRHQKRSRGRLQGVASSTRNSGTSGTRIFLGKPSAHTISKRFWDPHMPKFNNRNVGELTNPFISAACTASSNELGVDNVTRDAVETSSSEGDKMQGDASWWPPVPFLGLGGSITKKQSTTRSLYKNCEVLYKRVSFNFMSRKVLRYQLQVGEGMNCYERVRDLALQWEFDSGDKGIKSVQPLPQRYSQQSFRVVHPLEGTTASADRSESRGRRMVSWTRMGPLYVLNPVALIYECINQKGSGRDGSGTLYTSCAYATQLGHWLSGEERVTVSLRTSQDAFRPPPVEVEIVSISRAAPSLMGRLAWPLIGRMQDKFFVEHLRTLHRTADASSQAYLDEYQFTDSVQRGMGLSAVDGRYVVSTR